MTSNTIAYKGFKIVGKEKSLDHPMVQETIDFLASMDFCQTCVDSKGYELKVGNFHYKITFQERKITVS